ncbi:MAG: hypothetical protein R3D84_08205 [Paracoccaceae bacterium]
MLDEGVLISPTGATSIANFRDTVKGADMHPTFEHHHYKWSIET